MNSTDSDKYREIQGMLQSAATLDRKLVDRAEELAYSIQDDDRRMWALSDIAKVLAAAEAWDEAQRIARALPDCYEKADAWRSITKHLIKAEQIDRALRVLSEAEAIPLDNDVLPDKAQDLNRISNLLIAKGRNGEASKMRIDAISVARLGEASSSPQASLDSSSVLWEIAEDLALAGQWTAAVDVANAIKSSGKRDHALNGINRIRSGGKGSFEGIRHDK